MVRGATMLVECILDALSQAPNAVKLAEER